MSVILSACRSSKKNAVERATKKKEAERVTIDTNKAQRLVGIRNLKLIYLILFVLLFFLIYLYTELNDGLTSRFITTATNGFEEKVTLIDEVKNIVTVQNKQRNDKKNVAYFSIKPGHCVQTGMRNHCLSTKLRMIGVDQHHKVKFACYPDDVVLLSPKSKTGRNFPPRTEMHDIEKETLNDPEFVDILNTTNSKHSSYRIVGSKKKQSVGDVIKVRIDMVDGRKQPRTVGGDDVRIFMRSANGKLVIAGSVEDFKNGTYLGSIKLLWPGMSNVYVLLPFTRESRATAFKWRREYKIIFYYYGQFKKGYVNEYTLCSTYPEIYGYKETCNFNEMNHGYPWYCGQPLNPGLKCEDFIMANDLDYLDIPMTKGQRETFFRHSTNVKINGKLEVNVTKSTKQPGAKRPPCNKLSPRDTWNFTIPYGYFDRGQWVNLKCENSVTKSNAINRLRDTTLTIVGDSTTRQWYTSLLGILNCKQVTKVWTSPKWYDISSCFVKSANFSMNWFPHVFPFPNGKKEKTGMMNLKSVRQALMDIPAKGKYLLVFHHYAHYIREHYTLFRDIVRSLKPEIRKALKRNQDLKIGIKSPHSFHKHPCPSHLSDFSGPLYMDILKSELKEFHDNIWLLNYWEQTFIMENSDIHPEDWLVWENIRTFFGYTLP